MDPDTPLGDPPPTAAGSRLDRAGAVVAMIRTLTVPAVALFLIIAFFGPLSEIASILPKKFEEASKVSYGGFLIEVRENAKRAGNPELAEKIGDLTELSLRYLLNGPDGKRLPTYSPQRDGMIHYHPVEQQEVDAIAELEAKKLYTCEIPIKKWQERYLGIMRPIDESMTSRYVLKDGAEFPEALNIGCKLTPSGQSAVDLIVGVVTSEIAAARSADVKKEDAAKAADGS